MEAKGLRCTEISRFCCNNGCTTRRSSFPRYESTIPSSTTTAFDLRKVKRSLAENDLTVLSIFVNPAQFAPHEDLASYPRTLPEDLRVLSALSVAVPNPSSPGLSMTRKASAVFVPNASEMYPSGISQDVNTQRGTFVEVKGYDHQMEGQSRPTFFRGVATVVTKLFNVIEVSRPRLQARILSLMPFLSIANQHVFWTKGHTAGATSTPSMQGPLTLPS